jgi:hypothetical protein
MVHASLSSSFALSIAALALACGGAQAGAGGGGIEKEEEALEPANSSTNDRAVPKEPQRTVAASNDIRFMLRDLAVQNACEHELGKFRGLPGDGEEVIEGRTLAEDCKTESHGDDELVMRTGSRGWRWVGNKSKKLGGTFKVTEYATMKVELEVQGSVEIAYSRDGHVVNLWLVPSRPPKAHVKPLTEIDAQPEGAWSHVLGTLSTAVGQGPDKQATRQVGSVGSQQFQKQMSKGYSLAVDLCTGQVHEKVGELPEGKIPEVAMPSNGRIWMENERVRLHSGGIDLTGPFKSTYDRVEAQVKVEQGGPLRARLICKADATRIALAFTDGKKLPRVKALANEVIPQGATKTLKTDSGKCEPVLYTTPEPKADLPITFANVAYEPDDREKPFVPCAK